MKMTQIGKSSLILSVYILSGFILYYCIYRYVYILFMFLVSALSIYSFRISAAFGAILFLQNLLSTQSCFSKLSRLLCRSWYIVFSTILVVFVVAVIIGRLLSILLLLPNIYFILVFFTGFGYVFDIRFPYLSNDFYLHIIFFCFHFNHSEYYTKHTFTNELRHKLKKSDAIQIKLIL